MIGLTAFIALIVSFSVLMETLLFETCVGVLLLAPIYLYAIGATGAQYKPSAFIAVVCALYTLYIFRKELAWHGKEIWKEITPLALLFLCFGGSMLLSLQWPDFFPLGERLRDYAILGAVFSNPVSTQEPWFSGYTLNYYIYWYRLGYVVAQICGLSVWTTYHMIASLAVSLYAAAIFRLFNRWLGFGVISSLAFSLFIAFGPNVSGILAALVGNNDWWAMSRVIRGAITEFPAWSFVLGDIHPHYLNLAFLPLFGCYVGVICNNQGKSGTKNIAIGALALLGIAMVFNANAWELPVYCTVLGSMLAVMFMNTKWAFVTETKEALVNLRLDAKTVQKIAVQVLLIGSLLGSSVAIKGGEMHLAIVNKAIGQTTVAELCNHWGLALGLLTVGLLVELNTVARLGLCVLLGITVYYGQAFALIFVLYVYYGICRWEKKRSYTARELVELSFAISSFVVLMFPEIAFFDDAYGGESERMNTIFKFYEAGWFLVFSFAFLVFSRVTSSLLNQTVGKGLQAALIVVVVMASLLNMYHLSRLRWGKPFEMRFRSEGLDRLQGEFPGAAGAVRYLRDAPTGVVIEASEGAYNWATHVASLASMPSYLGWQNHIELLYQDQPEISRRAQVIEEVYSKANCEERAELIRVEGIKYVVVGPLEEARFSRVSGLDWGCFNKEYELDRYSIYSVNEAKQ